MGCWRRVWVLGRTLVRRLMRDDIGAYAAALTYSLLFALFPLALALAALVPALHLEGARGGLLTALSAVVPAEVLALVQRAGGPSLRAHPTLAWVGAAGYVWGMSGAFRRLIDAFNHAYEDVGHLRRPAWKTFALSLVLALTLGIVLVMAVVVASLGGHVFGAALAALVGRPAPGLASAVRWLVLLALMVGMLAILYWVGPDRPGRLRWFSPGSLTAIAVWLGISWGFSAYLARFNSYNLVYGGFGAGILLLLYLYFLSWALLLGAEVNALGEPLRGEGIAGPSAGTPERPRPKR